METPDILKLQLVILTGALVALAARRLRIPYTVGLVVAGFLLALLHVQIGLTFSRELLFDVLLPPLIFEAALYLRWEELRKDLLVVTTYATIGVCLSAGVTAAAMYYLVGWAVEPSLLFGVLIAATDPVSVIATFKEAKVKGRLRKLVEAESLFNDGTAAVAFAIALIYASGGGTSVASTIGMAAWSIFGGIASGLLIAGAAFLIIGRTNDHLVELSMTSVVAYGSFWFAEHFGMSGILAATAAGILVGNFRSYGNITPRGEEYIRSFWDFAAFIANTVIFLLLGVTAAYQDLIDSAWPIAAAIVIVLVGRALAVYPCSALFAWSERRVLFSQQHILFWGGLRGALALALALSIPASAPYRQTVLTVTFGVVAFSVIVQGISIQWLLRILRPERKTTAEDVPLAIN
ncbi:MAG TPA: sodium:proton antiporter [Pyrinomonadaceae bacterium]|nr:sodium:proton antiporter [Pyrinomonadaceae bacterium]